MAEQTQSQAKSRVATLADGECLDGDGNGQPVYEAIFKCLKDLEERLTVLETE
jgi:hypothetical protein